MIYFWSDTHFNHVGILKHQPNRKYANVDEMNEAIIALWNKWVTPKDTIYLLGDFAFSRKDDNIEEIFSRLNGHKHLVIGNHDERNPKVLKLGWESTRHLGTVKENERRVVVCHYPIESWSGMHKGAAMVHGHCHGSLHRNLNRRYDVGVDSAMGQHGPVDMQLILELADIQKFTPTDGHIART